MTRILVVILLAVTVTYAEITYNGYKVYTLTPNSDTQRNILLSWQENGRYDFWTLVHHNLHPVNIMVSAQEQPEFEMFIREVGIDCKVTIEDVQDVIDTEREAQGRSKARSTSRMNFDRYHRLEEITDYMKYLASTYKNNVRFETYGRSYWGRDLNALRISKDNSDKNPVIFIEAAVHAREWIAPAVALHLMQQLLENSNNSHMIQNVDWVIIPVVNVDGYEYTHTNERLWRKTRSVQANSCVGVDGNRNYAFGWGGEGSDSDPCSIFYRGTEAFSEPEISSIKNYAFSDVGRIKFYVAVHSYGNGLLYPWGYTQDRAPDADKMHEVAELGTAAIKRVNGTEYTVGGTWETMYASAGCSHDYMKGQYGVDLSYLMELPGGGNDGFDLPPSRIQGVVDETFQAFAAWHKYIDENFNLKV